MPASSSTIQAFANNDDAMVVWRYSKKISNCWGFALYRKRKGQTNPEVVMTSVGFENEVNSDKAQPSTVWPIQRYNWMDYFVRTGDEVSYQVVPMLTDGNGKLVPDSKNKSPWSKWVKIGDQGDIEAYFNRGMISSQFMSRKMGDVPAKEWSKKLKELLADPKSKVRNFLGGNLLFAFYRLLNEVKNNKDLKLYTALYELNEPELIKKLNEVGKRANVILANGAFGAKGNDPEEENAKLLKKVTLTRRIVKSPHFAHNKFLVVTDSSSGKELPVKVLTGSTNWTRNGLFTQVNNAVIIHDKSVAAYYKKAWDAIHADCDDGAGLYGADLKKFNSTVQSNKSKKINTYFTPVPQQIDMIEAKKYIQKAKRGILFLMFKPANSMESETLYKDIKDLADKKGLFVSGVINGDPGGKQNPTIKFYHKGKEQQGSFNSILPASLKSPFDFWLQEMGKPSVTIHSKVVVIDPFSDNPVVMTGSHNMGEKASRSNDDNLNIIVGNKPLAKGYGIHMMAVYHHYRWRFYRTNNAKPKWKGNIRDDIWQSWFTQGFNLKELDFWTKP